MSAKNVDCLLNNNKQYFDAFACIHCTNTGFDADEFSPTTGQCAHKRWENDALIEII